MKRCILTLLLIFSLTGALASVVMGAPPLQEEEGTPVPAEKMKGAIAFSVFDTERKTYDIYLANPDGSDRRKLIEDASQPALSADSTHIVYRSWASGNRGLIASKIGGEDAWRLTTHSEALRPFWGPLEQFYFFHSRQEADRASRIYRTEDTGFHTIPRPDLDMKDVMGEMPALVGNDTLVYKGCEAAICGLMVVNINGSGAKVILDDIDATAPAPSPDGEKVAYMTHKDGNWEVYIMNIDGSQVTRLTEDDADDGLPTWSPDGQTLAFVSNRGGEWAIWAMNPDGTDQHQLFALGGSLDGKPHDAPDYEAGGWLEERISWISERAIPAVEMVEPTPTEVTGGELAEETLEGTIAFSVFDSERKTYDIHLANPDGSNRRKLIEDASQPALSADGTHIVYRSWASGNRGLIASKLDGTDAWRFITHSEASRPFWGPLEQFYFFHSRQEADRASRIYRTEDTRVHSIPRPDLDMKDVMGEMPALVGNDTLVYKGCEAAICGLMVVNINGSGAKVILDDIDASAPAPSPDGGKVAYMTHKDGNWEVYIMNIDGSQVTRLTANEANDGLPIWSPGGQIIAFVSDRSGEWAIWAMNLDGTAKRQLFALGGSLDGIPHSYPDYEAKGWLDERISWCQVD